MTSAEDWATAIRVSDILLRGHTHAAAEEEPSLLLQRIAGNPVLCGGPVEHFSRVMPVWAPKTLDEERLRPIDVLYGTYDPSTRSIDIFVNRIHQDAKTFGVDPNQLLEIVRIHEHAHAVIHLGNRSDDVQNQLSAFGGGNRTAWSPFIEKRTSWFSRLSTELGEFLAQALTYAAISGMCSPRRADKCREVFDALEAKQPAHYKLSPSVKQYAARADWPLILEAARETIDVYREQDFTLRAGLEALVCSAAGRTAEEVP